MKRADDQLFLTVHSFVILCASMIACGLLAILFGKEQQWDLVSYHYYNAFAFLHHRSSYDVWPSNEVQLFFNPLLDVLGYFLINHFIPVMTVFLLGAIHGVNVWLMYCISYIVLAKNKEPFRISIAVILAIVGMYGTAAISEVGSFMGDDLISLFGLGAILLQLRALTYDRLSGKIVLFIVFTSGLVMGLGTGLKFTLAYAAIGMIIANGFIAVPFAQKSKIMVIGCVGMAIGFFLTYGDWMLFLQTHYHSPFFPFFNGWFKAPNFPAFNWVEPRFFPKTISQKIFYPFYFSRNGLLIGDVQSSDYRLVIVYLLLILNGFFWIFKKYKLKNIFSRDLISKWFIIFFIAAYIAWQILFSNIRYMVTLQIISPLVIYLLLCNLISHVFFRRCVLGIILYGLVVSTVVMKQDRVPILPGIDYFNVRLPDFVTQEKADIVLTVVPNFSYFPNQLLRTGVTSSLSAMIYDNETDKSYTAVLQTYLVPFFPASWRFVGVTTFHHEYVMSNEAKKMIQNNRESIYLLTTANNMPSFIKLANRLGFHDRKKCGVILSDRLMSRVKLESVLLCQIK